MSQGRLQKYKLGKWQRPTKDLIIKHILLFHFFYKRLDNNIN